MTVPTTTNEVSYTGTGLVSVYDYTFRLLQSSDLLVTYTTALGVVSTLVENTDYRVSGVLSYTGGTVTLVAGPLAAGATLVLTRAPGEVQDTSLQSQGAYDAKVVETGLDLLTMICQWLQNQVDRALVVPPGTTPVVLPDPESLALLQWNAGATGLQNLPIADLSPILLSGNFIVDRPTFTAGSTTAVTLSQAPGTVNNTLVAFDGVYQQKNTYTVSGTTLTFNAAIPLGVLSVEITQSAALPLAIPADNSVSTAAIQNGAVTAAKMGAASVLTPALGAGAVTLANLAASYLSLAPQYGRNSVINGAMIIATRPDYAASVSGTFGYGKVDRWKGAIVAGAVAGTLTQNTASSLGRTGYSSIWSGLTTPGATTLKWRTFIEKKDAVRLKNQTATFSAQARQSAPFNRAWSINVYKADAPDDFTAMTVISTGAAIQVPQSANTPIYNRAVAMGDCSNGVCVEVIMVSNVSVTGHTFELAEVQAEIGDTETVFEFRDTASELARCQRYYWTYSVQGFGLLGQASSTSLINTSFIPYPTAMRATPTVASLYSDWLINPGAVAVTGSSFVESADGFMVQLSCAAAVTSGNVYHLMAGSGTPVITFNADF